jgi:hypothetical protein
MRFSMRALHVPYDVRARQNAHRENHEHADKGFRQSGVQEGLCVETTPSPLVVKPLDVSS